MSLWRSSSATVPFQWSFSAAIICFCLAPLCIFLTPAQLGLCEPHLMLRKLICSGTQILLEQNNKYFFVLAAVQPSMYGSTALNQTPVSLWRWLRNYSNKTGLFFITDKSTHKPLSDHKGPKVKGCINACRTISSDRCPGPRAKWHGNHSTKRIVFVYDQTLAIG